MTRKKGYKNIVPILSIIVGILILIKPALLAVIVALFLIVKGILDLID